MDGVKIKASEDEDIDDDEDWTVYPYNIVRPLNLEHIKLDTHWQEEGWRKE